MMTAVFFKVQKKTLTPESKLWLMVFIHIAHVHIYAFDTIYRDL